jgi:hypothetical protein
MLVVGYVTGDAEVPEHDWTAEEGSFVYEPPGEIHTLTVPDCAEMITFFNISGAMIYVDADAQKGDVWSKIDVLHALRCVGPGAHYVEQFIR